jgi:hypothetical protein
MVKKRICAALAALTLLVVSCDSFFASSWGAMRGYEAGGIDINADNLDEWMLLSLGNPELAFALTEKIKEKVKGASPYSQETLQFQEAGVSLALEASGIGVSIVSNVAASLDELEKGDEKAVKKILTDIQADFKTGGGPQAAANLAEIVGVSLNQANPGIGSTPEFIGLYAQAAAPGDVGQAVLVLALAVLGNVPGGISGAVDDLAEGSADIAGLSLQSGRIVIAGSAVPEALVLAAYLNLIAADSSGKFDANPVTKAIKDVFGLAA